jgi:predicted outer membrane lipoprotein
VNVAQVLALCSIGFSLACALGVFAVLAYHAAVQRRGVS